MLHHGSRVTWTDPSYPCHLIETIPTDRALQPQGLPLKILVSINVATCPHGTTHVAKKLTHGAELCVLLCQELEGMLPLRKTAGGGLRLLCYSIKGVTREASPASSQRTALPQLASCSSNLRKLRGSSEFISTMCTFVSWGLVTNGSIL